MKKLLLITLLLGYLAPVISQNYADDITIKERSQAVKVVKTEIDPMGQIVNKFATPKSIMIDETAGTSILDVQTYGAINQRINVFDDGTVGATWMMSNEDGSWGDRGTAYNYYENGSFGTPPTERIESGRTGFPAYSNFGSNGEVNVSHFSDETLGFGTLVLTRETKGTGDWQEVFVPGPVDGVGMVWPKVVTGGEDNRTIHILAVTYGDPYMEQEKALLYYRSTDGGINWDITHHFFEELGIDNFAQIDAESYAFAEPKGDNIAFGVGFDAVSGKLFKSDNNGTDWEVTSAYETPWGGETPTDAPNFGGGDGAFSLAFDSENKVHIVFGRMVYNYAEGTQYHFPGSEGIIYWNEDMPTLDTTAVSSYTLDNLYDNGNLIGWVQPVDGSYEILGWGTTYQSLTTYPDIVIDNYDRMFVCYSSTAVGYLYEELNYRHIYVTSSIDHGMTWVEEAYDATGDFIYTWSESMFPDMVLSPVDNNLHLLYQMDNTPGWHYWLEDTDASVNSFIYTQIDKDLVIGIEDELAVQNSIEVSGVYPNPTNGNTNINIRVNTTSDVNIMISNMIGQTVYQNNYGRLSTGDHKMSFNVNNLSNGVYTVTVNANRFMNTQKLIIQ